MANINEILQTIAAGVNQINEAVPTITKAKTESEETSALLSQYGTETPSRNMSAAAAKLGEVEQHLAAALAAANEASANAQAARGAGGLLTSSASALPSSSAQSSISHGTQQKRAGVMEGPVIFSAAEGMSPIEAGQAKEYVDAANAANQEGKLSPTGRVSPGYRLKRAKAAATAKERARAEAAGEPYGDDVAAHLPDTTWVGHPDPPGGWGRHSKRLNSSFGSQSAQYPVGYRPTEFRMDGSWTDTDSAR